MWKPRERGLVEVLIMRDEFKYEVAFSFLQDDEQLALEIAGRIRERVSIALFIYSERQNELAGTDGVEKFSRVFGEESRVVVILFREGWGQTKWTRVEETAIRTGGFNEGHEFALLVKLDSANPPIWLPPTRPVRTTTRNLGRRTSFCANCYSHTGDPN